MFDKIPTRSKIFFFGKISWPECFKDTGIEFSVVIIDWFHIEMKTFLAAIPFSLAVPLENPTVPSSNDVCVTKVADSNPDHECPDTDRTLGYVRNLIGLINCPNGEASADKNPACAGGHAWWDSDKTGPWLSYDQLVTGALQNYGCNCFPKNKWIENNLFGKSWPHVLPGINGEPLDALDSACTVLARRVKCLDIDYNSLERLEDWPGSNGGYPRDTCDYIQWYNTHDIGNGITCGPENNPNYIDAEKWWYSDKNIGYHNMNQCRNTICEIEMKFARDVADLLRDPVAFTLSNLDKKGAWEKGMCDSGSEYGYRVDSCCGDKFERSPYDSNFKQCCGGKVTELGSC